MHILRDSGTFFMSSVSGFGWRIVECCTGLEIGTYGGHKYFVRCALVVVRLQIRSLVDMYIERHLKGGSR